MHPLILHNAEQTQRGTLLTGWMPEETETREKQQNSGKEHGTRTLASIAVGCSLRQKNCREAKEVKHLFLSSAHLIKKVSIHKRHRRIARLENTILAAFVQSRNPYMNKTNLQGGKKQGL